MSSRSPDQVHGSALSEPVIRGRTVSHLGRLTSYTPA